MTLALPSPYEFACGRIVAMHADFFRRELVPVQSGSVKIHRTSGQSSARVQVHSRPAPDRNRVPGTDPERK